MKTLFASNFIRQSISSLLILCTISSYAQLTTVEQFYEKFDGKSINQNFKARGYLDGITYPTVSQRTLLLKNKEIHLNELEQYKLITNDKKNAYIKIEYTNTAMTIIYVYTSFKNKSGNQFFAINTTIEDAVILQKPCTYFYNYNTKGFTDCTATVLSQLKLDNFFAPTEVNNGKIAAGKDVAYIIELPQVGTAIKVQIWPTKEEQLTTFSRFKNLKVKPKTIIMKWDKNTSKFI